MFHPYWPLIAVGIGVLSGASSGAFGIGGGVVNKPLLRLILATSPGYVIGSPIPAQFFGAILGSFSYFRKRMINLRLVSLAAPFAVVGTVIGAYTTSLLNLGHLMMLLVFVVLWAGSRMMIKAVKEAAIGHETHGRLSVHKVSTTAFLAGLLAGLLGLGGGFILVPLFSLLLRRDIKECIASSLAIVMITAIPNGITHWVLGHINWPLAFSLLTGQMIGVWFGTIFTIRSSRRLVYLIFGSFLIAVSLALARLEILNIVKGG